MTYPPVWGPLYHDTLMFFATHFPSEPTALEREEAEEFLRLFFKFVPCPSCAIHGQMYYHNNPPDTSSGVGLVGWVVEMHNDINKRTGKKHDWTVVEALQVFKYRYFNNQLLLSQCDRQKCEDQRSGGGASLPAATLPRAAPRLVEAAAPSSPWLLPVCVACLVFYLLFLGTVVFAVVRGKKELAPG